MVINAQSQGLPLITSFCTGDSHSCVVFNYRKLKCWGLKRSFGAAADYSALGDSLDELGSRLPSIDIGSNLTISQLSCGGFHVCLRFDNGNMKCIGRNQNGQTGIGNTTENVGQVSGHIGNNLPFVNIGNGLQVLEIAAGNRHTCIRHTGDSIKCFGGNDSGQLGIGDTASRGTLSSEMGNNLNPTKLGSNMQVQSIHSGPEASHNCAIISAPAGAVQRAKCWGFNFDNLLGYSITGNIGDDFGEVGDNLPLIDFGTESKVKQISLGSNHACFLLVSKDLKCRGINQDGQLFYGHTTSVTSTGNTWPVVSLDANRSVLFFSASYFHTCIVYDDQLTLKCGGNNNYGQLGQGDGASRGNSPTSMLSSIPAIELGTGILKISALETGYGVTCLLFEDATKIKCFGANYYGQLAIGSTENIGDGGNEMGNDLIAASLIELTQAPTQTPTKAPFSCNYPNQKPCNKDALCSWVKVGKKGTCLPFSCDNFTSSTTCSADSRCIWLKSGKKCVLFNCLAITKKKQCKIDTRCQWNGSSCLSK